MPESSKLLAPTVLQEKISTPRRGDWQEYVIAAPGYRVVPAVSSLLSVPAGWLFGTLLAMATGFSLGGWSALLIVLGGPAGWLYARLANRWGHNGKLISRGHAVRLRRSPKRPGAPALRRRRGRRPGRTPGAAESDELELLTRFSDAVTGHVCRAAKDNAPGYFTLARRLAEFQAQLARFADLKADNRAGDAVIAVRRQELQQARAQLRLLRSTDALARAVALLRPPDAAIGAAGDFTAVLYQEIQEGRSQADAADY
ncbi:hypothetical protein [Nakamurella aerolata]|uniref:Uncharacterized protein n=1 Tax=Nakamurella aerolata TaxID=1656892 RepID=A0A849A0Q5_9ACTN|nr:hypothetical protein [Nakamurella aerolata]NNG34624.1 hypothetical protein [Nakamurella aerolata]